MVLCLSGLDPSGGAGIQADMEAMLMTGSHCLPVITSLTVQNTQNVQATQPVNGEILRHQVESLLSDLSISAIKIGLLDGPDNVRVVADIVKQLRDVPVVG
ncbi:MAG TPA: hydroxymethylpyrimidine/phosphomethylpyrimidine kinase, partial [Pseudohongiella sp.]|nr:hydroxymethylpyrimidine/phosphomethylpyrimidine kinase [Pseudohongiella sp.]